MFTLLPASRHDDIVAFEDRVVLADGNTVIVQRANLAAAKALLAAERAAARRAAYLDATTGNRRQDTAMAS